MDNQHRYIDGYRELDESEIAFINEIKMRGRELNKLIHLLRTTEKVAIDPRWLEEGEMDLQKGLMALTRAVAQPRTF